MPILDANTRWGAGLGSLGQQSYSELIARLGLPSYAELAAVYGDQVAANIVAMVDSGVSPYNIRELDSWTGAVHYEYAMPEPTGNVNIWVLQPSGQYVWSGPGPEPPGGPPAPSAPAPTWPEEVPEPAPPPAAPPAPAPRVGTVSLYNLTRPGSATFYVGDYFLIEIRGADPNRPVYATGTQNGATSTMQFGSTDAGGSFSVSGTMRPEDVGTWSERWTVGETLAQPVLVFAVLSASATPEAVAAAQARQEAAEAEAAAKAAGAAPKVGRVSLYNLTRPDSDSFYVGDSFLIEIRGAEPNQPVYATGTHNGATSTMQFGSTDAGGSFSAIATMGPDDVGTWSERWTVGQTLAQPVLVFAVLPASAAPEVVEEAAKAEEAARAAEEATKAEEETAGEEAGEEKPAEGIWAAIERIVSGGLAPSAAEGAEVALTPAAEEQNWRKWALVAVVAALGLLMLTDRETGR